MISAAYEPIINWINTSIASPPSRLNVNNVLFISGKSGIGKSHSIKEICNKLNLEMIYITSANCSSSNDLEDLIVKASSSSMLQILLNHKKPKIVVIDEFESIVALDKTINTTLLNILEAKKLKSIPIICIASIDIVKRIGILKKKCTIFELSQPTHNEICKILYSINPEIDKQTLDQIINKCNGNISQCIENINNNMKKSDQIDEWINANILYATVDMFNRENIRRVVETDPWLIPLKYHENLPQELDKRKISMLKSQRIYKDFMLNFVYFDNFPLELQADMFASIIYPISRLALKTNAESYIDNFTKVLSYLSLQKKYIKKCFTNSSTDFPFYHLSSYHTNIATRNNMFFN